jgi:hypothetical protein
MAVDRPDGLFDRARAAGYRAVSAGVVGGAAIVRDADGHAVLLTESGRK